MGEELDEANRRAADMGALAERLQEGLAGIFQKVGRGSRCKLCNKPIYFMPHLNLPRPDGKTEIGVYNSDGTNHQPNCRLLRMRGARSGR